MARLFKTRIKTVPKVGNIYWCSLPPEDVVHLPEFWKRRPVVVISRKNNLVGKVVVLPLSTSERNRTYPHSVEASSSLLARMQTQVGWIVCDHPMTVATSRLDYFGKTPLRMDKSELDRVLGLFHSLMAGGSGS